MRYPETITVQIILSYYYYYIVLYYHYHITLLLSYYYYYYYYYHYHITLLLSYYYYYYYYYYYHYHYIVYTYISYHRDDNNELLPQFLCWLESEKCDYRQRRRRSFYPGLWPVGRNHYRIKIQKIRKQKQSNRQTNPFKDTHHEQQEPGLMHWRDTISRGWIRRAHLILKSSKLKLPDRSINLAALGLERNGKRSVTNWAIGSSTLSIMCSTCNISSKKTIRINHRTSHSCNQSHLHFESHRAMSYSDRKKNCPVFFFSIFIWFFFSLSSLCVFFNKVLISDFLDENDVLWETQWSCKFCSHLAIFSMAYNSFESGKRDGGMEKWIERKIDLNSRTRKGWLSISDIGKRGDGKWGGWVSV